MNIQCTDTKNFELIDDAERVGQIQYDSRFSYKAKVTIGDVTYSIHPMGMFSTIVSVIREKKEVANMRMNWKGHIIIAFQDGQEFVMKVTGTFANKYVVQDKDHQEIMCLDADFNWKKCSYNYNITYDKKQQDLLLVLLAAYSVNYYISAMSAGM